MGSQRVGYHTHTLSLTLIETMPNNVTTWLLKDANLGKYFLISKGSGYLKKFFLILKIQPVYQFIASFIPDRVFFTEDIMTRAAP